jgi:cytochrome P450
MVVNLHRLRDYLLEISSSVHTHKVGIASIRIFITSHPDNLQHIFTTNHANYPKGEAFAEIFDVARGSLFTVDGEAFRRQRARYQGVLSNPLLVGSMIKCCRDKVEEGLLPMMAHLATTGAPVDMSDLMVRLVFDMNATSILGVDPARLSLHMPPMDVAAAMDTVMEVGFLRYLVPPSWWKAMRHLNVGPERRLAAAQVLLRHFAADMIAERRRMKKKGLIVVGQEPVDVISSYIDDPDYKDDDNLLQATLITYMIAGRDTVSTTLPWIFHNLAKHPRVVSAIRDELAPVVSRSGKASATAATTTMFEAEEVKPLVYLQAVLLETLRLYPPIPVVSKSVAADDVMPTGDKVCAGDMVLLSLQSTGRMEVVWGSDSQEFRPERWLLKDGRLRHVPSHKFPAFVMGPRLCLGKDIAITLLKIIVAAVVWNFDVDMLDGQAMGTKLSCLLQMKDGLKVMLNKREM